MILIRLNFYVAHATTANSPAKTNGKPPVVHTERKIILIVARNALQAQSYFSQKYTAYSLYSVHMTFLKMGISFGLACVVLSYS